MNMTLTPHTFPETIAEERDRLFELKENITVMFGEMGNYMLETSVKIKNFRSLITPYINYFYPNDGEKVEESFAKDVVVPSRDEMSSAIDEAVAIMRGDHGTNDRITGAIRQSLDIKKSIDEILSLIDAIDIYSVNTMLISSKAGTEGETLTQISMEMAQLSEKAGRSSENFMALLEKLQRYYDDFTSAREKIDIVNENYLTQMKLKSSLIFREILGDLDRMSGNIHEIMHYSEEVEASIRNVMEWLQTEDLVRQDLEKVIFSLQELGDPNGAVFGTLTDPALAGRISEFFMIISLHKMKTIGEHIDRLINGNNDCNVHIKDILNRFLDRFYGSEGDAKIYYEGDKLDDVYKKLEDMKSEFIGYIEKIIEGKNQLFTLSNSIFGVLEQFSVYFNDLVHIAKRFEIINMLTKIELARHTALKRTLAGALTGVKDLPTRMKKIIEKTFAINSQVKDNMNAAIAEYHESYKIQENTLNACISAMKKISVKLNESKKYYRDISEEVGSTCTDMLAFVEEESAELQSIVDMKSYIHRISGLVAQEMGAIENENHTAYTEEARVIKDILDGESTVSDYRIKMLSSLVSEYQHELPEERVYIF